MDTPVSPNGEQQPSQTTEATSVTTPASQPGAQPSSQQNPDVSAASSAAPEGVKEPTSVLEAVQAALKKPAQATDKGTATEGGESPAPAVGKGSQEPGDAKAADSGQQPVKDANTRIRELNAENKALAPKAQHFDALSGYLRANNVSSQEFQSAIGIAVLAKTDPEAAIGMLQAQITELGKLLDAALPEDIQARLDAGAIDEESAREIARMRRGGEVRRVKTAEHIQAQHEYRVQQEAQGLSQSINAAVTNAEATLARTDPDYPQIKDQVVELVELQLLKGQVPQTPEAAVKQFHDTVAKVKKFAGLGQRPRAINPSGRNQDTGGQPAPVAPKTALEAAQRALETARA